MFSFQVFVFLQDLRFGKRRTSRSNLFISCTTEMIISATFKVFKNLTKIWWTTTFGRESPLHRKEKTQFSSQWAPAPFQLVAESDGPAFYILHLHQRMMLLCWLFELSALNEECHLEGWHIAGDTAHQQVSQLIAVGSLLRVGIDAI